ncbi:MAG: TPM domain-containing protein, partial [Paludisphaera borealis]|uniref:TPM domain-containing protein n=1 Tax=Paludisphaera borealis TaxID=1387353 RepID=UPI002847DA33
MTAIARVIRSVVLATATATMLAAWEPATAQEATPLPVYTGARLYVKDVPDHYESVARTIKDLERQSPQSYFVVVVKSSGAGQHATRDYLDRLYDSWRRDAKAKNLKLDPERSVVVVAALDNRQVAVHPGSLLRDRFGLKGTTIDGEIVQRAFIPLARENDYPGALSALLTSTNNFLAAHGDSETKAVASQGGGESPKPLATQIAKTASPTSIPVPPSPGPTNRNAAASTTV